MKLHAIWFGMNNGFVPSSAVWCRQMLGSLSAKCRQKIELQAVNQAAAFPDGLAGDSAI